MLSLPGHHLRLSTYDRQAFRAPDTIEKIELNGKDLSYSRILMLAGVNERSVSPFAKVGGKILLLLREGRHIAPAPLWESSSASDDAIGYETLFPPNWNNLCAVLIDKTPLWNREHPLVRAVTRESWKWAELNINPRDPRQHATTIAKEDALLAAWILQSIGSRLDEEDWLALRENMPKVFEAVASTLSRFEENASQILRVWDFGGRFGWSSDTLEISATSTSILNNAQLSTAKDGLDFPSGFRLPLPIETRCFANVIRKVEPSAPTDE